MNIINKTILITGGSGIGFEIAKQLVAKNNQVIINNSRIINLVDLY